MSQTMILSDTLCTRLEAEANKRGLETVEQLLEHVVTPDADMQRRQAAVRRVKAIQKQFDTKYGVMTGSAKLLRADRER